MIDITHINSLVGKEYDEEKYHCWNFIEEALGIPTLEDVHVATALDDIEKYKHLFKEIDSPIDGCIVMLGKSHGGIWYKQNIYHNDKYGVRCESKRSMRMKYRTLRFFEVNNDIC